MESPETPLLASIAGLTISHHLETNTLQLNLNTPTSLTLSQTRQLIKVLCSAATTLQEASDARFHAQHSRSLF